MAAHCGRGECDGDGQRPENRLRVDPGDSLENGRDGQTENFPERHTKKSLCETDFSAFLLKKILEMFVSFSCASDRVHSLDLLSG